MNYEVAYEIAKINMPWDTIIMGIAALVAVFVFIDGVSSFKKN